MVDEEMNEAEWRNERSEPRLALPKENKQTNSFSIEFDLICFCGPASHHSPKEINQSINQSNQSNFQFELMIDDCWWFRWRWPPSARSTSIYSFHSQIEAFSWAAKLFNSFFISLNCPFSKSNSKRNKENWVSGGKKSNSSIPSIIDFIIIPLSFHEIPSIIEVLSLFDSFNYCYNIILIPFILHEIKIKLFLSLLKEEKVVFDGMKRLPLQ